LLLLDDDVLLLLLLLVLLLLHNEVRNGIEARRLWLWLSRRQRAYKLLEGLRLLAGSLASNGQ